MEAQEDVLKNYPEGLKKINSLSELYALSAALSEAARAFYPDIACKNGCYFCCIKAGEVFVTPIEWQLIKEYLSEIDEEIKKVIEGQVKAIWAEFSAAVKPGINTLETICNARCAFLVNGSCSIYPVRPLVCRNLGVTKHFSQKIPGFFVPHTCQPERRRWIKFSEENNTLELNLPVAEFIYEKLITLCGSDYSLQHLLLRAKEYFENKSSGDAYSDLFSQDFS